jgi:hypothetical protein
MLSRRKVTTPGDPQGYTPIQCYVLMDSHGERSGPYPCTDYDTLDRVLKGKENVNLQIKMWIDTTIENSLVLMPDEVREITKECPEWVFNSYINRLSKQYFQKHGWTPTFIRKHL